MSEIKFRAYIPDLDIMLYDVAVYPDGMIGISADSLEKALSTNYKLYDNTIYYEDFENGNNIFYQIMSILSGDDWFWFEKGQFELTVLIDGYTFDKVIYENTK